MVDTTSGGCMTNIDDELLSMGVITISGDISEETFEEFHKKFIIIHKLYLEKIDVIEVSINSVGGELTSVFAICDLIKASEVPVKTVALGCAMSGGFLILISGKPRVITNNTMLMCHNFRGGTYGDYGDLVAKRKMEDISNKRIIEHLIRHSNLKTEKRVKEILLKGVDSFLEPSEALKYGLVDVILKDKK